MASNSLIETTIKSSARFSIRLINYSIDTSLIDDSSCLVVTFEPMERWRLGTNREGWGLSYLQNLGCSVMAVMSKQNDWYRKPDLLQFFSQMHKTGFFHGFERVVTYGGSMGGYAALAYADVVNAGFVLSINPQASLSAQLAPWETRFAQGKKQNWEGDLANAANGFKHVKAAYVVYDPLFPLDAKHIKLLKANPKMVGLKVPVVGHHMPQWMMEMNILKPTVEAILKDQLTKESFHKDARKRSLIRRYWRMLISKPRVVKSPKFTEIVMRYANQQGFSLVDESLQ